MSLSYDLILSICRPSEYNERHGNNGRKIPTDGLVLRGFYNAITLAVYGTLSKSTAEQLAQAAQQQNVSGNMDHSQSTSALDNQVTCTSSAQMVENHVDSIAGTRQRYANRKYR